MPFISGMLIIEELKSEIIEESRTEEDIRSEIETANPFNGGDVNDQTA